MQYTRAFLTRLLAVRLNSVPTKYSYSTFCIGSSAFPATCKWHRFSCTPASAGAHANLRHLLEFDKTHFILTLRMLLTEGRSQLITCAKIVEASPVLLRPKQIDTKHTRDLYCLFTSNPIANSCGGSGVVMSSRTNDYDMYTRNGLFVVSRVNVPHRVTHLNLNPFVYYL